MRGDGFVCFIVGEKPGGSVVTIGYWWYCLLSMMDEKYGEIDDGSSCCEGSEYGVYSEWSGIDSSDDSCGSSSIDGDEMGLRASYVSDESDGLRLMNMDRLEALRGVLMDDVYSWRSDVRMVEEYCRAIGHLVECLIVNGSSGLTLGEVCMVRRCIVLMESEVHSLIYYGTVKGVMCGRMSIGEFLFGQFYLLEKFGKRVWRKEIEDVDFWV